MSSLFNKATKSDSSPKNKVVEPVPTETPDVDPFAEPNLTATLEVKDEEKKEVTPDPKVESNAEADRRRRINRRR
jgi:hypothetical protein